MKYENDSLQKKPTPSSDKFCIMTLLELQRLTNAWVATCFGETIQLDPVERNHRFLEEALELVQSCDMSAKEAHMLVDYVFNREAGEKSQELGGVLLTLAALCNAQNSDMVASAETELRRVWLKIDKIREKQKAKPREIPL